MDDYLSWAQTSLGITLHHPITIASLPGHERAIRCINDIPADSKIMSVPFTSLLTTTCAKGTPLEPLMDDCREDDMLVMLLLCEKHEVTSKWARHIEIIPSSYDSIINYTDTELEYIKGSNLHSLTLSWKQQTQTDYSDLLTLLRDKQCPYRTASWLTFENYLWALCTIWSRFVTVEKDGVAYRAMVPVFDILNHHPKCVVGHTFHNNTLSLVTSQTFKAGSEVTLNYGPLSNTKLLMLYGFSVPPCIGNPHDAVEIWATFNEHAPNYAIKERTLRSLCIFHATKAFEITHRGPSAHLIACLRIQYATPAELPKMATAISTPLSTENESRVASTLTAALEGMLRGYPETVEQDYELLSEWLLVDAHARPANSFVPPSERFKNAVIMRFSEKAILRDTIIWVEVHKENLTPDSA